MFILYREKLFSGIINIFLNLNFFFGILIWKKECRFLSVPKKYLRVLSRCTCVSINICKSIARIEIYCQNRKNPFSQNFKISCNDFESENKQFSLCLCNLLLQIVEEFVIKVLSEFVVKNSITWNNDFLEFVIFNCTLYIKL